MKWPLFLCTCLVLWLGTGAWLRAEIAGEGGLETRDAGVLADAGRERASMDGGMQVDGGPPEGGKRDGGANAEGPDARPPEGPLQDAPTREAAEPPLDAPEKAEEPDAEKIVEGRVEEVTEHGPDAKDATEQRATEPPLQEQGADGPSSGDLTPQVACERVALRACEAMLGCCGKYRLWVEDVQVCARQRTLTCLRETWGKEREAFAMNHLVLDAANLKACEALWQGAKVSCVMPSAREEALACGAVFLERAWLEETCLSGLAGVHCAGGRGSCVATPGKVLCQAWGEAGSSCLAASCKPGLYCIASQDGQGASCRGPGESGARCVLSVHCQAGLRCVSDRCASLRVSGTSCTQSGDCASGSACHPLHKMCVPQVGVGEACTFAGQCGASLRCHGLAPGGSICRSRKPAGGLCTHDLECQNGTCLAGVCKALPAVGESCRVDPGCQGGARCDTQTDRCVAAPQEGESCREGLHACAPGLVCLREQNKRVCRALRKAGEACTDDSECKPELGCQDGSCKPLPKEKQPCLRGRCDALLHYCDADTKTCKLYQVKGTRCPAGNECDPSLTCVPDREGEKRCSPLPETGEACRLRCRGQEVVCVPSVQPGSCLPTMCQDFLQCDEEGSCLRPEGNENEQASPDGGSNVEHSVGDKSAGGDGASNYDGARPQGGCACTLDTNPLEAPLLWTLLALMLLLYIRSRPSPL